MSPNSINSSKKFSYKTCQNDFDNEKSLGLVKFVYKRGTDYTDGCTGTLISDNVILTAARCLSEEIHQFHVKKHMSIIPRRNMDLILHPDYKPESHGNIADIALIKIKNISENQFDIWGFWDLRYHSQPICLPIDNTKSLNQPFDIDKIERKVSIFNSDKCNEINVTKGIDKNLSFYKNKGNTQIIHCTDPAGYVPEDISGTAVLVKNGNIPIIYGILTFSGIKTDPLPIIFIDIRPYLGWIIENIEKLQEVEEYL
ncbi:ovochymase-like [Chironomus tepperi]|uniref:ovochymase-like n=1 Tax=Chironomus tepperi TaxID=113505 RepID=UPI00391F59DF